MAARWFGGAGGAAVRVEWRGCRVREGEGRRLG